MHLVRKNLEVQAGNSSLSDVALDDIGLILKIPNLYTVKMFYVYQYSMTNKITYLINFLCSLTGTKYSS